MLSLTSNMAAFNNDHTHTRNEHLLRIRGDVNTDPTALPHFDVVFEEWGDCTPYKIFINNFRQRGVWGYAIFRTVYTPQSEHQFPLAIAKIERYLRSCLEIEWDRDRAREKRYSAGRLQLLDVVMRCFQNTIFEDPDQFNNRVEHDLVIDFKIWLADKERNFRGGAFGDRHFIVIDGKILNELMAAPDDIEYDSFHLNKRLANLRIVRVHHCKSYIVEAQQLWFHYHNGSDSHNLGHAHRDAIEETKASGCTSRQHQNRLLQILHSIAPSHLHNPHRKAIGTDEEMSSQNDFGEYRVFIEKFKNRGIWGYAIFRTVYTPESNEQFPIAIAKLDRYIRSTLESEDRSLAERQRLVNNIIDCYQNTIFEDHKAFNNATARDLDIHFRLWVTALERVPGYHQCFGYSNFIMIDEETLSAIMATPHDDIHEQNHEHDFQCRTHAPAAIFQPAIKLVRLYDRDGNMNSPYELWFSYSAGSSDHD